MNNKWQNSIVGEWREPLTTAYMGGHEKLAVPDPLNTTISERAHHGT